MIKIRFLLSTNFFFIFILLSSQVNVRLLTDYDPENVILKINSGDYRISNFTGASLSLSAGDLVFIARHDEKIFIKLRNGEAFTGDSVEVKHRSTAGSFSLKLNSGESVKMNYSGDLKCFSDMGKLILINTCDIEEYIAGVVKAEGGNGKSEEYFRTQAIIARTYIYKYFNKHIIDRYNLCDDTHCQAFKGLTSDSLIINAVSHTEGQVITTPDSILIISAFHSNCGGETSPSDFAWVTPQSYLASVEDRFCTASRNAAWEQKIGLKNWTDFLTKNGYSGIISTSSNFVFDQPKRVPDYVTGSFSIPLKTLRSGFGLKSSFFSVTAEGDSLLLKGRGYGHGVGLCQEGAMEMAYKGFTYQQIIDFYYSGVLIIDIKNAVLLPPNSLRKN